MVSPLDLSSYNPAMIRKVGRNATSEPCYRVFFELMQVCPWCVMAPHAFASEEKELLVAVGRQIGTAIDKMRSELAQRQFQNGSNYILNLVNPVNPVKKML